MRKFAAKLAADRGDEAAWAELTAMGGAEFRELFCLTKARTFLATAAEYARDGAGTAAAAGKIGEAAALLPAEGPLERHVRGAFLSYK